MFGDFAQNHETQKVILAHFLISDNEDVHFRIRNGNVSMPLHKDARITGIEKKLIVMQ